MREDDLEPYINKDKRYMTDEERIRHLEHWIREQRKEISSLRKEKAILKAKNKELEDRLIYLQEWIDSVTSAYFDR